MIDRLAVIAGILRSIRLYYFSLGRRRRMLALYREFLAPGELAFDIGAHVGDRVAAFRRLGARVVAVEPQPALARLLRIIYGRDRAVIVEPCLIAARSGEASFHLNPANPTVATASAAFVAAAADAPGWSDQRWRGTVSVRATTLDTLIDRYGEPAFIKIDVEGFEAEALSGLSRAVRGLSFEFTTLQRGVAAAALARVAALGPYRFNAALGESHDFIWQDPVEADALADWLQDLPDAANSGDIYAIRVR